MHFKPNWIEKIETSNKEVIISSSSCACLQFSLTLHAPTSIGHNPDTGGPLALLMPMMMIVMIVDNNKEEEDNSDVNGGNEDSSLRSMITRAIKMS